MISGEREEIAAMRYFRNHLTNSGIMSALSLLILQLSRPLGILTIKIKYSL